MWMMSRAVTSLTRRSNTKQLISHKNPLLKIIAGDFYIFVMVLNQLEFIDCLLVVMLALVEHN